ncbi:MAG: Gfo/Idh/MocA family oxidoreductase [Planctomycetes bacterium]|nr:Gfo/Idh/MocA family oxidoreductase [Planctomycetota bacterium]
MSKKMRWGILGTGMIANVFARALEHAQRGCKQAVGSRSGPKAAAFATTHQIPRAYGSTEALLADPEVDAVYVSTPHPVHRSGVLAAAAAGKHVLCEKPMGVTPGECEEMIEAARRHGVVLLEAFMYRVHPQTLRLQEILREGRIGTVRTIRSSFTYGMGDAYNVRTDLSLRGGGLYDVGCYCINFSRMVAGQEPDRIAASWWLGPKTGVDENLAAVLGFPSGPLAHFDVGIRCAGTSFAEIVGSSGRIHIPNPWKPDARRASFDVVAGGKTETVVIENGGDIFSLEADHLAAVAAGEAKPLIPAENAVGNAVVMDTIWRQMHG